MVTQIAICTCSQSCQELLNSHIPNASLSPPCRWAHSSPFFSNPRNSRGRDNPLPGVGGKESCCTFAHKRRQRKGPNSLPCVLSIKPVFPYFFHCLNIQKCRSCYNPQVPATHAAQAGLGALSRPPHRSLSTFPPALTTLHLSSASVSPFYTESSQGQGLSASLHILNNQHSARHSGAEKGHVAHTRTAE